jgi:hypothetical protein
MANQKRAGLLKNVNQKSKISLRKNGIKRFINDTLVFGYSLSYPIFGGLKNPKILEWKSFSKLKLG